MPAGAPRACSGRSASATTMRSHGARPPGARRSRRHATGPSPHRCVDARAAALVASASRCSSGLPARAAARPVRASVAAAFAAAAASSVARRASSPASAPSPAASSASSASSASASLTLPYLTLPYLTLSVLSTLTPLTDRTSVTSSLLRRLSG